MGWAGAVAGLAGNIGGALIGRSGQSQALKAQERATQAQIQLERDRDAAKQRRYDTAMSGYTREKEQYDSYRRALLEHYGIKLPAPAAAGPGGAAGAPAGMAPMAAGGPAGGPANLGQLMQAGAGFGAAPAALGPPPVAAPGAPGEGGPAVPDVAAGDDAFDWRRYGVQG